MPNLMMKTILPRRSFATGFKIYTKTGDKGTSALYTGTRLSKDAHIFHSLGAIDELNGHLGLAREHMQIASVAGVGVTQLEEIQARLIDVGSHVATPRSSGKEQKIARTDFGEGNVLSLEEWIDTMDEQLPPLTNFILPSGGLAASQLHVARSVCRRAERNLVPLFTEGEIDGHVYTYVNRLSDFLFTLARTCSHEQGREEAVYKKAK